jgi:hypothetical protein
MTIFLGCGFAAKYREGGGNFSVPLQWMLGLRRLKLDAIWLEVLPSTGDPKTDRQNIRSFQGHLREHGLAGRYCLLLQKPKDDEHDLAGMECFGMSKQRLVDRLAGPNVLLNLSYSVHPPLLLQFERRVFCDLDPSEIFYWMTKMEMGQSFHHEFWTIGLNVQGADCRLPRPPVKWKTFYPLADCGLMRLRPRPPVPKFTTIGQWYWSGAVEVDGEFPDLSKRYAFEPYLNLPKLMPAAAFELAMNIGSDAAEMNRLQTHGWRVVDPHRAAGSPKAYRRYLKSAMGEFTAIKGVDVSWKTGWISDRAAAFMALGRPAVTEDAGAGRYLPGDSGMFFISGVAEATEAIREVVARWDYWSKRARACAEEVFDSTVNLRRILNL